MTLAGFLTLGGCGGDNGVETQTVGTVIADIERHANSLMDNARIEANAAASQNIQELQFAAQNTALLLSDQMDQKIDKLDGTQRDIFQHLQALSDKASAGAVKVDEFRADLAIDANNLLGRIPFSKNLNFMVERIEGTVYGIGSGDIKLGFKGIGLADQSDLRQAKISEVAFDGQSVPFEIQRIDDRSCRLVIHDSALASAKLKAATFGFVNVRLKSAVEFKDSFGSKQKQTFTFETTLTVVPEDVGTGTLTYEIPKMKWTRESDIFWGEPYTTPNYDHPKEKASHTVKLFAPPGKRIVEGTVWWKLFSSRVGANRAPWTTLEDGPKPDRNIIHDGQEAYVTFLAWGPSITVTLNCKLDDHVPDGTDKVVLPVIISRSHPLRIRIPKSAATWHLEAKTLINRPISISKNETVKGVLPTEQTVGDSTDLSFGWQMALP